MMSIYKPPRFWPQDQELLKKALEAVIERGLPLTCKQVKQELRRLAPSWWTETYLKRFTQERINKRIKYLVSSFMWEEGEEKGILDEERLVALACLHFHLQ